VRAPSGGERVGRRIFERKAMMSKTKARQQRVSGMTPRKSQIVIAVAVVLSLFAAGTMLAYSGALDSVFKQKSKKGGTVSTASFNSNSPSKEYVYAGGNAKTKTFYKDGKVVKQERY
jgi:hypothetical protein